MNAVGYVKEHPYIILRTWRTTECTYTIAFFIHISVCDFDHMSATKWLNSHWTKPFATANEPRSLFGQHSLTLASSFKRKWMHFFLLSFYRHFSSSSSKKNISVTHLPGVAGARTNLTANKNWIAQTSRQHRFKDKDNAHSASVTS